MRQTFPSIGEEVELAQRSPLRWAFLPGLCCQAAGGEVRWADEVAAAWLLYYVAAHIMDTIEDQDEPDPRWASLGIGPALNIASGLYFSASLLLSRSRFPSPHSLDGSQSHEFYRRFLVMCGGQHRDLLQRDSSLDSYWVHAREKSGAFFALACRSGASLASSERAKLDAYHQFGENIGIAVQLLDDLEDFKPPDAKQSLASYRGLSHSLPLRYALEVLPEPQKARLLLEVEQAASDWSALAHVFELVESSGASMFLLLQLEKYRTQAYRSLQEAQPHPHAAQYLEALVQSLDILNP